MGGRRCSPLLLLLQEGVDPVVVDDGSMLAEDLRPDGRHKDLLCRARIERKKLALHKTAETCVPKPDWTVGRVRV